MKEKISIYSNAVIRSNNRDCSLPCHKHHVCILYTLLPLFCLKTLIFKIWRWKLKFGGEPLISSGTAAPDVNLQYTPETTVCPRSSDPFYKVYKLLLGHEYEVSSIFCHKRESWLTKGYVNLVQTDVMFVQGLESGFLAKKNRIRTLYPIRREFFLPTIINDNSR